MVKCVKVLIFTELQNNFETVLPKAESKNSENARIPISFYF